MHIKQSMIILTLFALLGGTSESVGEDCWNLAYRYCCQHQPDFYVPCTGVEGGYCEGIVYEGPNEFGQVRIPPTTGAMTASSFNYVGDLECGFHPAGCYQLPFPHCEVDPYNVYCYCEEWVRKNTFSWCPDTP